MLGMRHHPANCLPACLFALAIAIATAPAQAPTARAIDPTAARVLRRGIDAVRALTAIELEVRPRLGEAAPAEREAPARRLALPAGVGLAHRTLLDWHGEGLRLRIDQDDGTRPLRTLVDDGKVAALFDHVRREYATDADWRLLSDPIALGLPQPYLAWHGLPAGALPRGLVGLRLVGEAECDGVACDVVEADFDFRTRKQRADGTVSTMRERYAIARGDGLPRRWSALPPADVVADPDADIDATLLPTTHASVRALAPAVDARTFATRQPAELRRVEPERIDGMIPESKEARAAIRRMRELLAAVRSPRNAYLGVKVGEALPDVASTTADGAPFTLAALRGKAVVLLVWHATANLDQRAALANLRELHVRTAASGAAVTFVAVQGFDSLADTAVAEATAADLRTTVVARGQALTRAWRATLTPIWIVLDPVGAVTYAAHGALAADDEELLAAIEAARPK